MPRKARRRRPSHSCPVPTRVPLHVLGTSSCLGGGKLFGCSSPSHLTTSRLGHKVFLRTRRRLSVLVDFLLQPFCYSTSLSLPLFWHRAPSPRQASSSPSSPLVRVLLGPSSPKAPIRQAVTPSSAASQLRACIRIALPGLMDSRSPGSARRIPSPRGLLVSCTLSFCMSLPS